MQMLTALMATAHADVPEAEAPERVDVHDPSHPVALGSRIEAWTGPYTSPALGGHIKLKPHESFGVEGFMDHTLQLAGGIARHDHVIGFSLYTPAILGDHRWFLSPTLGACVDFRADTPFQDRGPSNADILFGTHAGAMLELAVGEGWSVELDGQGFVYWGNQIATDSWSATASNRLHATAVFQSVASINYAP